MLSNLRIWHPCLVTLSKKNHIQSIEAVQRRFTPFCFSYQAANSPSYPDRLAILNLPPLYNRMVYLSISLIFSMIFFLNLLLGGHIILLLLMNLQEQIV